MPPFMRPLVGRDKVGLGSEPDIETLIGGYRFAALRWCPIASLSRAPFPRHPPDLVIVGCEGRS